METHISYQIKKILISFLAGIFKGFILLGQGIKSLFLKLGDLIAFIFNKLLKPVTIPIYRGYLNIGTRLKKNLGLKKRLGFLFANRYVVHVIIIIIALFVSSTNILQAKEVRSDEFQTKTILSDIIKPEISEDEEIVETAASIKKVDKSYINTKANLVANIPEISKEEKTTENFMLTEGGSALVKSNILDTEFGYSKEVREYVVGEGETLSQIAEDFEISLATVQWANNFGSSTVITPGQTIKIPPVTGVTYTIQSGDTLLDIVSKRKGDIDEVREFNDIGEGDLIAVGTTIVIPNGQPYVPPAPAPAVSNSGSSSWTGVFKPATADPAPPTGAQFIWPSASHDISQYSHWGHVAIDIRGPMGTAIYASASGVAYVYGGYGGGYGNHVIIDHGNGWSTLYGHLSSFAVSNGQYVSQGQVIGGEGSTGWSTGPHLHFEVRQGGSKYNPLSYVK